jgi:hypothetical protein
MFGASPGKITRSPASSTSAECTTLCNPRGRRAAQQAVSGLPVSGLPVKLADPDGFLWEVPWSPQLWIA